MPELESKSALHAAGTCSREARCNLPQGAALGCVFGSLRLLLHPPALFLWSDESGDREEKGVEYDDEEQNPIRLPALEKNPSTDARACGLNRARARVRGNLRRDAGTHSNRLTSIMK